MSASASLCVGQWQACLAVSWDPGRPRRLGFDPFRVSRGWIARLYLGPVHVELLVLRDTPFVRKAA